MIELEVDQQIFRVEVPPSKPLLWVLREDLGIINAKFSCGYAACGACSVYVGKQVVRSCVYPVSAVGTQSVRTVAGLNDELAEDLKDSWQKIDVPQCGYCQPGFVLSAHQHLSTLKDLESLDYSKISNLCRCGTQYRIRKAMRQALENHLARKENRNGD